jgi:aspartate/methionine/tyrosine aminotransferase
VPAALAKLRPRRDLMARRLNEIPGIRTVVPQAAFYIFPEVTGGPWANDTEFIYDLMESTGIVGVPGSGFSPGRPGRFFRLVYLAHEDEINAAMDKLEAFMKKRLASK